MNSQIASRTSQRRCCAEHECEQGLRNNYFEGKQLSVDSFRVEQDYALHRRRLLNRAIHGWGVVYGFKMDLEGPKNQGPGRLKVGPGLALDPCGRELLQPEICIEAGNLPVFDESGKRVDLEVAGARVGPYSRPAVRPAPSEWWLLKVHYAEENMSAVPVNGPCGCEQHEWDHLCETVRYSLWRISEPASLADCCGGFPCELECQCGSAQPAVPLNRGGYHCLCEHLTELAKTIVPDEKCGAPGEIEVRCERVRVDLQHGVPLACVQLVQDDCGHWMFGQFEACGPRRLVKRNDLLFDLIRGCDLTRISKISWHGWHRHHLPVAFEKFSESFGHKNPDNHGEYITDFTVEFSRPVQGLTLGEDCFAFTVISAEREGGWWQEFRVPVVRVIPLLPDSKTRDCFLAAAIVVDRDWVEDGLRGRRSIFVDGPTRVEIEIRGDFIIDCNGQAVDANAIGRSPAPTGNGTPGGTFLSTFRVQQRAVSQPYSPRQNGID